MVIYECNKNIYHKKLNNMLSVTQSREVNRTNRLAVFLEGNASIYSTYAPFAKAATNFFTNRTALATLAKDKEASGTAETRTKAQLKAALARGLSDICSLAHAYAVDENDNNLLLKTDVSERDIILMKDADVLPFTKATLALFTPTLMADTTFITYEITPAAIAAVLADATAFNSKIGVASVVDAGASNANTQLNNVIKLIRGNITQMERLLVRFKTSHPAFVTGFGQNSVVENTGVRHSGIEGKVNVGGVAAVGAVVSIVGTTKTDTTDATGSYSIISVKPGTYQVQAIVAGKPAITKTEQISRGHIDELNFEF